MAQHYSQFKAFRAIVQAALRSISKSPSSVIFTIAFPLVFILVFGFLGGKGGGEIKLAFAPGSDTSNVVYKGMRQMPMLLISDLRDSAQIEKQLAKGALTAIVAIENTGAVPAYKIKLRLHAGDQEKGMQLTAMLKGMILAQDPTVIQRTASLVQVEQTVIQSRKFQPIDFVLPGQLGFSLLAASVFGTAFVFFNLRQGLVLKRFFATPVRRTVILLAEGFARMLFQLAGALFIILIGYFVFGYTLVHGVVTVIHMLLLCALGLLVFMSFGFIISGMAKSESTIPPLSNIITLPQFLLAGTFFPVEAFPMWMQPVARALPLTYLNHGLREIAFEGAGLWAIRMDIAVLLLWGIIGYFAASRVFKWE